MKRKIIIDTDPGQDDAVAILMALASPDEIELLGIVAVAGNVGLERTAANARKVRLTEKETAILRFLYRAGQMPVSRETLLQEVWGYNSGVTTHTLETHIYRLRQKVEKDASAPAILVTEGGGYKLMP